MNVGTFGPYFRGIPAIGPIKVTPPEENLGPSRFPIWANGFLEDFPSTEDHEIE